MVLSGGEQHRRNESANQRKARKQLGILGQGQRNRGCRYQDHGRKGYSRGYQGIQVERSPQ